MMPQFISLKSKMGSCITADKVDAELHKINNGLQSNILSNQKDKLFIYNTLKTSQLQLIFRASEHQFSAEEFHKACDHKPHTLTLIKTQFGKIIGGYTPCSWESPSVSKYIEDSSGKSCLFSFHPCEKMTLSNSSHSIRCFNRYGPFFGESDIYISDKCNDNSYSFSYFPDSYSSKEKYSSSEEAIEKFSGATKGGNFKVVQYEVFLMKT